jgi:hypothetical protein
LDTSKIFSFAAAVSRGQIAGVQAAVPRGRLVAKRVISRLVPWPAALQLGLVREYGGVGTGECRCVEGGGEQVMFCSGLGCSWSVPMVLFCVVALLLEI